MNIRNLTLQNVQSYADACRHVHEYIEVLRKDAYDLVVVPSRGAHPFLHGAQSYAHQSQREQSIGLSVPSLIFPETLYLPFTADIADDQPISSAAIRKYWSQVLAAILRGDKNDISYRFYEYLRNNAGRLAFGRTGKTKVSGTESELVIDVACGHSGNHA